jgi:amino acid transporter
LVDFCDSLLDFISFLLGTIYFGFCALCYRELSRVAVPFLPFWR